MLIIIMLLRYLSETDCPCLTDFLSDKQVAYSSVGNDAPFPCLGHFIQFSKKWGCGWESNHVDKNPVFVIWNELHSASYITT